MDFVRVLNRSPYTLCYMGEGLEDYDKQELLINPGKWIEVGREFATKRLARNSNLLVDWGVPQDWKGLLPWPHLTLASPLGRMTGWGTVGERFAHHLIGKVPLRLSVMSYWDAQSVQSKKVKQLMAREDSQNTAWALCATIPPELPRAPSPLRVLYSMWETGDLPNAKAAGGDWAGIVNEWAKALIVPSKSQREMWIRGGVTVPVYVVGLGVSEEFRYFERPQRDVDAPFTILLYGMLTSRKSPIETIQTCWNVLGDKEDWKLILKTRAAQLGAGQFTPTVEDNRIQVVNEDYTPEEMNELCQKADVGFYMSKYEGFGLPPREMMATGLPVIWTRFSGHLEDCDERYNIPVAVKKVVTADEAYAGLGGWGEPDWEEAGKALRREYDEWKGRGKTQWKRGRKSSEWIKRRCDWERRTGEVLEVVEKVVRGI